MSGPVPIRKGQPAPDAGKRKKAVPIPVPDPAMFTGLLGEIAEEASEDTEADKVGIYVSLLAMAGAVAGHSPHIMIGDRRHPLLVWPVLIGRTGSGRKGDALATGSAVMDAANLGLEEITVTGLSTGEGLIWHIRDVDENGNGTDDKRVLVVEEELGHVIAVSSRENSTLSGVLRKAWDGGRLQSLTKNSPYMASSSHVTVIANITPREFRTRISNRDLASGLWNRYLPLFVERRKLIAVPAGLSLDLLAEYGEQLSKAVTRAAGMRRIDLSVKARRLYEDELYPEFADLSDEEDHVADFMERAAPYCRRIAALTGALGGSKTTSEEDMEAAGCLVRYALASARYVLDAAVHDPRLDRLRRAVDEAYPDCLSGEDVRSLFNRHLMKPQLKMLVDKLCEEDAYELTPVPTGGRPRQELRRVSPLP